MQLSWDAPTNADGITYKIKQRWANTQLATPTKTLDLPNIISQPFAAPTEVASTYHFSVGFAGTPIDKAYVTGWFEEGLTYEYSIQAVRGTSSSDWTGWESIQMPNCMATPLNNDIPKCQLTNLAGVQSGGQLSVTDGAVWLTWNAASNNNFAYHVYQKRGTIWKPLPVGDHIVSVDNSLRRAVVGELYPGETFEFKVRGLLASGLHDSPSHSVTLPPRIPIWGHQPDHTVKYELSRTSFPTPDPSLPTQVPDPSSVMAPAVATAASKWNTGMGGFATGPRILFCEGTTCGTRNSDGNKTTVLVESGEVSPGKGHVMSPLKARILSLTNRNITYACGWTSACVGPALNISGITSYFLTGADNHIGDLVMVIEEPAYKYFGTRPVAQRHVRYWWTSNHALDDVKLPRATPGALSLELYLYLPITLIHEFGHTAGLHDLTDDSKVENPDAYIGYMMHRYRPAPPLTVPLNDLYYIREAHRNADHGSGRH